MFTKTIEVNGITYTAIGCLSAAEYHEQHVQFSRLFENAPEETKLAWANSDAFKDPTLNCTPEQMADSENNFILFSSDFAERINKDPERDLSDETVMLLKPSGIFSVNYKDAMSLAFPRDTTNLTKTDLDPKVFIDAINCP